MSKPHSGTPHKSNSVNREFARRDALKALVGATLGSLTPKIVGAQGSWPNRPLKMIIPFPSGGTADVLGRLMSQRIADAIGQPIVIDNKPGAAGNIGSEAAAKSPNDGYNFFYATIGTHGGINLALYPKLAYDPVKDFIPIALAHTLPNVRADGGVEQVVAVVG